MAYLSVANFWKYQNADVWKKSKGHPPWFKHFVHRDREMDRMPLATRLLWSELLAAATRYGNVLEADLNWLWAETRVPVEDIAESLPLLVKGGWLSQTDTPRRSRNFSRKVLDDSLDLIEEDEEQEQEKNKNKEPSADKSVGTVVVHPRADEVEVVYGHWRNVRGKTDRRYDSISPARRQKIQARLREFPAADLIRALDAVAFDPWPDRDQHDDVTKLFKNREAVDRWLELAEKGPPVRLTRPDGRVSLDALYESTLNAAPAPTTEEVLELEAG